MSATQNGRGTHLPSAQASRFFEKAAPALQTVRRSTPDSEVLASSDDDHEHPMSKSTHSLQSAQGVGMPKPARRASWLSEVQSGPQRKFSIGSASSLQHSQPSTPAAESGPANWSTSVSRAPAPAGSYPWAGGWTMAPPATMSSGATAGFSSSAIDDVQPFVSSNADDHEFVDDSSPYHFNVSYTPVRKNVRSQSYSAGQQQPSDEKGMGGRGSNRVGHRPSRPSMLGEGGTARPVLGLVMEDEGDEAVADTTGYPGTTMPRTGIGRHEPMTPHNLPSPSLLKQAAVENALAKQRHSHSTSGSLSAEAQHAYQAQMAQLGLHNVRESPWNEGDEGSSTSYFGSEPASNAPTRQARYSQRPTWSSNLGFGEIVQGSESRRASFADPRSGIPNVVRTRTMSSSLHSEDTGSLSGQDLGHATSVDDRKFTHDFLDQASLANTTFHSNVDWKNTMKKQDRNQRRHSVQVIPGSIRSTSELLPATSDAAREEEGQGYADSYFKGEVFAAREAHEATAYQQQATVNPYAVPQTFSTPTPDLFIVAFKCARAGTFYVPPNTGLEVKVGDNVIVEGDRGVDLGTVTHAQVTLAEAKQLTQAAKDAHFKWLMMFSKTKQAPSGSAAGSVVVAPEESPTAGGNRSQPANSKAEDRPKMIRSIATHHQIQQLREKEGAEAKAKRVAQVKVGEHGLEMEILDAEMQYDWKKLTFFFYSPKYVNFNNLVIDLFKIYKTRIWMDAVTNGASQAAQDEVLGAVGPVVASSSQSAVPPTPTRDTIGAAGTKKPPTRRTRPENDGYHETLAYTTQYAAAGTTSSPLQLQSTFAASQPMGQQGYSPMSQINTGFMGSPPLSASAYSPYDPRQGDMAFQGQYGGYPVGATQQAPNDGQWAWKHMQSPATGTNPNPNWNSMQAAANAPMGGRQLPSNGVAQRASTAAADPEQLTAYLRNLALSSQH